jgi:hypothetical protein
MSELATYTLAQCFPGKYRFAKSGSMEERERQHLASLNVYRARRGLAKVRPSTAPPKVKLISSSVVLPLIERFVKEGGKAARGRLEAHGLGALPYVAKAANEAREPGVKKRLTDLARRMSCILRSAQIENARPGTETKVSQQIRAFVGQVLTTDRLFEILEVLAKGVSRRDARAASFVAERDATQTGFTISIRFTTEISQGGTSVTLNGDWVRSGGGADPSSFMGKIDDYLGSGIHRCLLSDRKTPIDIQVAIAKPFKG